MTPRAVARATMWASAYLLMTLIGPAFWHTSGPANATPAVALAFAWMLVGSGLGWRTDVLWLGTVTVALQVALGSGPWELLSILLALIGPVGATWLLQRWTPHLWGAGGRLPLTSLRDFGRLLVAVSGATLAAAVARSAVGVAAIPGESWDLALLRWGRSSASIFIVAVVLLIVGGDLARRRDAGLPVVERPRPRAVVELLGVMLAAAAVFWLGFAENPQVPTTFLLSLSVVWAAVRFPVSVAAVQAVAVSVASLVLTNAGVGPIAEVEDLGRRMLLAYVFGIVMVLTGLVIGLTRRQFFETIARLRDSEAALTARAAELDQILENLEDGVAIVEESGRVVHANTAIAHMLTGEEDAPEGEGISDEIVESAERYHLFHPDGRPLREHEMPYARALRGEVVTAHEYHLRHPRLSGTKILEINAFLVATEPGAPRRSMVTVRDVTAARAHSDALIAFAGTVAHDLNNPLSVIDGWAEALEEEFTDRAVVSRTTGAPMVRHIRHGASLMRRFIADLLAHAVARDQVLRCEVVDLDEVVRELVAARRGPDGSLNVEVGAMDKVWADRSLVRQLLDNLLGNAVKYVAPGQQPNIRVTTAAGEPGWLLLRVFDNGIGVPPEHREQIFETFHRGTGERTGTGLGLAICKRIVERHGGTITVRDNPEGAGSCFEMSLPLSAEVMAASIQP